MRLFIFLLALTNFLSAQTSDSLLQELLQIQNDTERVNQIYKQGFALRLNDPQTAYQYAVTCEKQAKLSQSQKHLAKSYNLLGVLFYRKGDFLKARNYHEKALSIRRKIGDKTGAAHSLTNLGNIYIDLKWFDKAERNYLEAIDIHTQQANQKQIANCFINLGAMKQNMEQPEAAKRYYELAMTIGRKTNDYDIQSICLNNIAIVKERSGKIEDAISLNKDALKMRLMMDNQSDAADSYLNLASNYIKLHQLNLAQEHLDSAFSISTKLEYFEARLEAEKVQSELLAATRKFEEAYQKRLHYEHLKDSIQLEQANQSPLFDETEELNELQPQNNIHNFWLLLFLPLLAIFAGYLLFRFKR